MKSKIFLASALLAASPVAVSAVSQYDLADGYGRGGMMMGSMMRYTGGFGFGLMGVIGWLWAITWTVNSVLIGILLWALIKKYWKR